MTTTNKLIRTALFVLAALPAAAENRVFYAGNTGAERFNDVHVLSDGTLLIAGQAENLGWIPASVPETALSAGAIQSSAAGSIAFILHTSADAGQILRVVRFPTGSVRDVFKIRSSEVPGQASGSIFISGSRDGAANDGYYLAKLNGNFVSAAPTALSYSYDVGAAGDLKERQSWDVGGDDKVVFALGQYYNSNWSAIQRLNAAGVQEVVPNWTAHWAASGEWDGTPASSYGGASPLLYSAVVMKASRKGSLRSANAADFSLLQTDANGNAGRKGRYPDDYYFAAACELSAGSSCTASGPGYTGYTIQGTITQRVGGIAIDRRTNDLYFGYSTRTTLPGGNPDFEPALVAMRADGSLKWWDRLYKEQPSNSTPDQYVDGVAFDHARNRVITLARQHGNNTFSLWPSNTLTARDGNVGFQQQFTGTTGNIHISWLGQHDADTGRIRSSTYLAELPEATSNTYGAAYTDPFYAGWANFNLGWLNLNTTRCGADAGRSDEIVILPDSSVAISCVGRRSFTTRDAHQAMPRPNQSPMPIGSWNFFVRVYSPDFSAVNYSSLLTGAWNNTGMGGDNTTISGLAFANGHVLAVGHHQATNGVADGENLPVAAAPSWGLTAPSGQSALLARLTGARIGIAMPDFDRFYSGFED